MSEEARIMEFFRFACERESIRRLKESGHPPPWTTDPVLQQYRFCNIFREDDKTTRWFRENIREPLRDDRQKVILATVGFRWFNRIEVGELIKDILLKDGWDGRQVARRLHSVKPLVTGAYMIKTPAGMNKLDGICWCMHEFMQMYHIFTYFRLTRNGATLRGAWSVLKQAPYLGDFMAYEVVTDLRHTCVLEHAKDIRTWANPGPGAARGLGWIVHDDPTVYSRHSERDRQVMMDWMKRLLELSYDERYWYAGYPRWEMREVEHTLCEFDKWKRGHAGQRLKRRYTCTS